MKITAMLITGAVASFACLIIPFIRSIEFETINGDEYEYTVFNQIRTGFSLNNIKYACSDTSGHIWMPLTRFSYMLDYELANRLYGIRYPDYYEAKQPQEINRILHAHNVFLHAANGVLIFGLIYLLLCEYTNRRGWDNIFTAWLLTVFWGVHPLRCEPVCWVAGRKDLLSLFWTLVGILLWLSVVRERYKKLPRIPIAYVACIATMCFAVLSKPIAIVFPFLVLFVGVFLFRERLWQHIRSQGWFYASLVLIAIICSYVMFVNHGGAASCFGHDAMISRFSVQMTGAYFWKTFLPVYLFQPYLYKYALPQWYSCASIISFFAVILVYIFLLLRYKLNSPEMVLSALIFVSLILVSGIIPVGIQSHADRFMYLPGVWVSCLLAFWVIRLSNQQKKFWFSIGCVLCFLLGGLAWRQSGFWKNDFSLFTHADACSRGGMNFVADINLAADAFKKKEFDEALKWIMKLVPTWDRNLSREQIPFAIMIACECKKYSTATAIQQRYCLKDDPFVNAILAAYYTKQINQTCDLLEGLINASPRSGELLYLRGKLAEEAGNYNTALDAFERCLRVDFKYVFLVARINQIRTQLPEAQE